MIDSNAFDYFAPSQIRQNMRRKMRRYFAMAFRNATVCSYYQSGHRRLQSRFNVSNVLREMSVPEHAVALAMPNSSKCLARCLSAAWSSTSMDGGNLECMNSNA